MGKREREREEFIRASSSDYHAYAWEKDGHPAMQRTSLRRFRHPWRTTRRDWIERIAFLAIIGAIFGAVALVAWLRG
jgi:hypothetical protein